MREGWLTARSEGTRRHYRLSPELDPSAHVLWEAVRDELSRTSGAEVDRARARGVLEARAERSRAFFSSAAGRWDGLRQDLFGARVDLQLLPGLLAPRDVVGDLGCGTGRLARALAPFAEAVIAVDRSAEMLAVARTRLDGMENVQVREGEIESLPIEDATLDVAILSLVLHYVVDPLRALLEVHRVLRPGARLLVLDMLRHQRTAFREEMGHVWLGFSPEELNGWVCEAGFHSPCLSKLPADPDTAGPLLFNLRAFRS
jgi:ArsR family transcriptional regulator